ncbi:MAG: hypothetical protein ACH346_06970 [Chthoniobacterales bacterium]
MNKAVKSNGNCSSPSGEEDEQEVVGCQLLVVFVRKIYFLKIHFYQPLRAMLLF